MANKRVLKPNSGVDSLLVLCGLFAVFLVLGVLRSMGWSLTVGEGISGGVTWVAYALLLVLCALFIWAVQAPERATYLLGGSAAFGVFPAVPKLPFLQDVTHVMLILFLVSNWRYLRLWREIWTPVDPRLAGYLVFLLVAVVSVAVNFLQRGDVWQLKVGLSGLLLLGIFLMVLCVMVVSPAPTIFKQLRNGFLDSAQIAAAFGCVALVLLVVTPYSTGLTGDGQDTLWGFGYFDRLKLMFDGPGIAAIFFVGAMSFALHALIEHDSAISAWSRARLLFLVMASPWLIVATGSRVGKIALVILILTMLLSKSGRRAWLIVLPTTFAALLIALDFQSFPSALKFNLGHIYPEFSDINDLNNLRLADRFFALEQRGELMSHAIFELRKASFLNQMFGMGYGVSGYSASLYPAPHNQFLGLVVEVGVLGFVSFFLFWLACSRSFLTAVRGCGSFEVGESWAFGISLISIFGLAFAYEIETKGWVLIVLLMIFNYSGIRRDKSRSL
jgi:hypothetical protein